MFDANGVICTDVHKAFLELLSPEEILKTSVCKITSTIIFDGDEPRAGGLHDPAMGSLDPRIPCITCGCKRDCPGHLGHIEFPLPVFHPTLLPAIVKFLKTLCFRCRRIKLDPKTASIYVKKFQLIQNGMLSDLEQFDMLHGKVSKETTSSKGKQKNKGNNAGCSSAITEKRIQLIKLFTKLQDRQAEKKRLYGEPNLPMDISECHATIESWSKLRSEILKTVIGKSNCSHCNRHFRTTIKQAPQGVGIDISWPWGTEKPFSQSTWRHLTADNHTLNECTFDDDDDPNIQEDDDNQTHGKRGKVFGSVHFQPYQMINLLKAVWNSPDKLLLEFLYPMSVKNGWEIFFIRYLPVSANRFRPLTESTHFGSGSGLGSLHNRTSSLVDILSIVEKMSFALGVLRHSNPLDALLNSETAKDPNGVPLPNITEAEKSRLKKIILEHEGNYKLLSSYSRELQQSVNQYIDSSKALNQRGNRVAPGIRQWIEKKQGAIRQKMMGKRVNFAARTVIAPDNCIHTNEIGIPIEFAKKLTIPEYVTAQSAAYLQQLVENGANVYPGANMIEDSTGFVYDLNVMSDDQRRGRARMLFTDIVDGAAPKIVYRHVRDGDIVIMNRQPTLHRASMMGHFVRVLRGWKTFRLMYVNCGSYNADFDGDEMNMHLPQDLSSRSEAQSIINSDCHYITAKNGEPLRGLIQDHVLGGCFLTCRDTFLNADQYYTLLYVGMASFVDRGPKMYLSAGANTGKASIVAMSACAGKVTGDPYSRLFSLENIRIVVEPPTLLKPQKLWTGKQVITSILKTLVDSISRSQFKHDQEFLMNYKGFNFQSKSKTPGDAWGGVLDGDKEESTIIIQNSELLQGVFDKSMFGASAFGIVHLCFEILGSRASGILLSVFAKTFICFLQMRGFSCCTGDFLMTPEGERNRERMILHCTIAGNYLQEIFIDSINKEMKWQDPLTNNHSARQKLQLVQTAFYNRVRDNATHSNDVNGYLGRLDRLSQSHLFDSKMNIDAFPTNEKSIQSLHHDVNMSSLPYGEKLSESFSIPETYGINYAVASTMKNNSLLQLTHQQKTDVNAWKTRNFDNITTNDIVSDPIDTEDIISSAKHRSKFSNATNNHLSLSLQNVNQTLEKSNIWDICRQLQNPLPILDWRTTPPEKMIKDLEELINSLGNIGRLNPRLQHVVMETLTKTPELSLYFPRVSKLLGTFKLWGKHLQSRLIQDTFPLPPNCPYGRLPPPKPNAKCTLPSGRVIVGDGSLRLPQLYHPSWLFKNDSCFEFEDTKRYSTRIASIKNSLDLNQYKMGYGVQPFCPKPNELTRLRFELLAKNHFAGREDVLIRMSDGFFQSGMGRLTSKNNDLVSGNVTLYKFPFNGFSSMITTGAKGSKVNFAMICGMLSQQSLEGKRVPVMVSGKTLPSFGRYDLGARAGGLITDRYLTGLRPQEYFFHCMAGREGLVDTAVKTARSGYLQRCVMKGMEGVMVQYDGTVRDSDSTIIQFLYGEDGIDVSKASYSKKLDDLLQNPTIIRAKYGGLNKLSNPIISESIQVASTFLQHQNKLHPNINDDVSESQHMALEDNDLFSDPISNVYSPTSFVGSTSEHYRTLVDKTLLTGSDHFIMDTIQAMRRMKGTPLYSKVTPEEQNAAYKRLEHLLLIKYAEMLCVAGEGVGCLSAQSMGEPATQMTLNTFHLAGHGAANVTLGIPRLREILQTAGNTKTPFLYIPIKGDNHDEAARHAETVLLGFKRIPLIDVIHAIGVESNVYHQFDQCRNGLPEYQLNLYKNNIESKIPKFFWEYETTIQFENLDHFCKVVPKFTPHKIISFTINRVVKDMMRQVTKLLYIYSTKYAEEEVDSDADELEDACQRFVFERDIRSHYVRRDIRKERARNAGVGFGAKNNTGDMTGSADLLTNAEIINTYKKKSVANDKEDEKDNNNENQEDEDAEQKNDSVSDSDQSKDDSEQGFSDSDMGDDAQQIENEDDDADMDNKGQDIEKDDTDTDSFDEDDIENITKIKNQKKKRRLRDTKTKWKGLQLEFDKLLHVLKTDELIEPDGEELEPDAMWSDSDTKKWKLKPLPEDAYRFLTDIKICRKTWRIVLKFGWPMERCPRRVTMLNNFVKIVKKYTLQDTPGVQNPRIVGGDNTETKSQFEIQCEGSNFGWISRLKNSCIDHNRVTSNDIRAILQFFGVEACRLAIIRELNKVFSVYGITVDYRHMSLIADTMTHSGFFRPFSRLGLQHHSSPFLQMSFETSMKFLTEAIERGACDNLKSPAGAIVTGKPTCVGSGMCRILPKLSLKKIIKSRPQSHVPVVLKKEENLGHIKSELHDDTSFIFQPNHSLTIKSELEDEDYQKKKRKIKREDKKLNKKQKFIFS